MTSYLMLYFGVSVFLFMGITMFFFMDKEDIKRYTFISLTWIVYIPLWITLMIAIRIVERKLKAATGWFVFKTGFSSMISNNFKIAFIKVLFMRRSKLEAKWKEYQDKATEHQKKQREMIENLKKRDEFAEDSGW